MKKIFMLLSFSLLVVAVSAQVKFGLKGGLSFANAKYTAGTSSQTLSSVVTPNLGVTLDFPGSESFNIQTGLMYSGMGGKETVGTSTTELSVNYLSIPVLAKVNFGSGFHGYAGPQLSILMSGKYKYPGGSTDIKNEIQGTGFFGIFGVGYSVSKTFRFYGEYIAGLSNLAKTSTDGDKWNANAFSVGIGLNLSK